MAVLEKEPSTTVWMLTGSPRPKSRPKVAGMTTASRASPRSRARASSAGLLAWTPSRKYPELTKAAT